MSLVVGVHGIGQQLEGAHTLAAAWEPALRSGVKLAGGHLDDGLLTCAFYGDLFRPKGGKALGAQPYVPADVDDEWERAFLGALWQGAAEVDAAVVAPDADTKLRTPNMVQRALNALSQSKFFSSVAQHGMIANLKQVKAYLHDDDIREQCRARVEQAVTPDTRVVIGHSLGSVVVYETLCAHPEWEIGAFVTLGSPLGISNLVFDLLRPAPGNGLGQWAGSARAWTNVADSGDVVALVKELDPLFDRTTTDLLVNNGAEAHAISPYLTASETGKAILDGLDA